MLCLDFSASHRAVVEFRKTIHRDLTAIQDLMNEAKNVILGGSKQAQKNAQDAARSVRSLINGWIH